jgi:hypothetical protein
LKDNRTGRQADLKTIKLCGIEQKLKLKTKKKPPFPTKGTAAYNPKQRCCIHSIFVGVPYARTLNKFMIPARFSDLRSKRTLPIHF